MESAAPKADESAAAGTSSSLQVDPPSDSFAAQASDEAEVKSANKTGAEHPTSKNQDMKDANESVGEGTSVKEQGANSTPVNTPAGTDSKTQKVEEPAKPKLITDAGKDKKSQEAR